MDEEEGGMLLVRMPPRHRHHARPGARPRLAKGLFVAVVYFLFCALLQMDTECYTNNTATCKEREEEREGGRVRRQQSRKSKRRTKKESHQNRTTHREQTKRTQRTEQRRKNNAKV